MKRAISLAAAAAAILGACAPDASSATTGNDTVVDIIMTDNAYAPSSVAAAPGQTITFVFRNEGTVKHEAVFGNLAEQEKHHAEMAEAGSGGEHGAGHDSTTEMHAIVVEPGETVEVQHTVAGPTLIGCHVEGHWEAGMKMEVTA